MNTQLPTDLLADCKSFADKHRGKNIRSGPHWSLVIRFPKLYDEAVRLLQKVNALEAHIIQNNEYCDWFLVREKYVFSDIYFQSACGATAVLGDGSPNDHGMNFCPNCGKLLRYLEEA